MTWRLNTTCEAGLLFSGERWWSSACRGRVCCVYLQVGDLGRVCGVAWKGGVVGGEHGHNIQQGHQDMLVATVKLLPERPLWAQCRGRVSETGDKANAQ